VGLTRRTFLGSASVVGVSAAGHLSAAAAPTPTYPRVSSQSAMLRLAAKPGEVVLRTDLMTAGQPGEFVLTRLPASQLANWVELKAAAGVLSVAGRSGSVTLSVADVVGAAPLASPHFTGTPEIAGSPVLKASDAAKLTTHLPLADGVADIGSSGPAEAAWAGHVHPATSTGAPADFPISKPGPSRALTLPAFVGYPTVNRGIVFADGVEVCYPLRLTANRTLTGVYVATAAGGSGGAVVRFGVRQLDGTLIADLGTVSVAADYAAPGLEVNQPLVSGIYLITACPQGAPTTGAALNAIGGATQLLPTLDGTVNDALNAVANIGYTISGVTGALPARPSLTPLSAGDGSTNRLIVGVQF
jgi:hypothetical protein